MTDILTPQAWQEYEGDILTPETQFPTDYSQAHKNDHELRHEHPEQITSATPVTESVEESDAAANEPYDHRIKEGEHIISPEAKAAAPEGLAMSRAFLRASAKRAKRQLSDLES